MNNKDYRLGNTGGESDKDFYPLDNFFAQIDVQFKASGISCELKKEILADVDRKIKTADKRKVSFRRAFLSISGVAAVFFIAVFFWVGNVNYKEQLLSTLDSANLDGLNDISIVWGDAKKVVSGNVSVTSVDGGDIMVGGERITGINADYITVVVPRGKRATVVLSDGTVAWINSGSKLTYPKEFGKRTRSVSLDGEMYIEVARDEKRPFHVYTDDMNINVLGTKFNLSAYREENVSSVILLEGSVEVEKADLSDKLVPGQGFFDESGLVYIKQVDTYPYVCWKDGKMKLVDEPFDALLRKLSRYYGVEINADLSLNTLRFEGNLNLKDSIEDVLNILSLSKGFGFEKNGNVFEIKK
ncbi:DUF4974 domain-containing protein [Paludibacter sp. 221]|uniref:FecR family protein n=1 Tax=Paludibacter sp. 221 TaxID=2302939 RepID=UPI0013D09B3A|nr:FecR domain-containing protein [Paludibacter sp. 221]NDV47396.1 DUF4974 domain-containing protein [Paludibacter sp. 221]